MILNYEVWSLTRPPVSMILGGLGISFKTSSARLAKVAKKAWRLDGESAITRNSDEGYSLFPLPDHQV